MNEVEQLRALLELFGATGACAQVLRDVADELEKPAPAPWSPRPGQRAQIKPGADRAGVPESGTRVLVLDIDQVPGAPTEYLIGWPGDDVGGEHRHWVLDSVLAPVQPRVWDRAEDVPNHVLVETKKGFHIDGSDARDWAGPYREVLPEVGAQ